MNSYDSFILANCEGGWCDEQAKGENATTPQQGEKPASGGTASPETLERDIDELLGPLKNVDPAVILTSLC